MIRLLIIGNSFGTDASRYLAGIARGGKRPIRVVNLYIGGCSLYRHYRNMLSEEDAYAFEADGVHTGLNVSLKKALLMEEWDYVAFQQCSPKSGNYATYQPYLNELAAYVRRLCPPAKLVVQQTWTFDRDCTRFALTDFDAPEPMLAALTDAYRRAAEDIGAALTVPSGEAVFELYRHLGAQTYRDGFHAHLGHTRYLLGCLWFTALTGCSCVGNPFRDFDVEVSEETVALVQRIVDETARSHGLIREKDESVNA